MRKLLLFLMLALSLGIPRVQADTVTMTSFTATSGNVGNSAYISYATYKGGGTSNPYLTNNTIRLYQPSTSGGTGGYILFHKQSADAAERRRVDEYVMETYDPLEVNTLYVIFSTSNFARALDSQIERDLPAELSENDFRKWLALLRLNDDNVTVREIPLTIRRQ